MFVAGPVGFAAILLLKMDSKFQGFESLRFRTYESQGGSVATVGTHCYARTQAPCEQDD